VIETLGVASTDDGREVVAGLSQQPKALPPKYFYDDRGSQLFEAITTLPEYYLTRTETQILQQFSPDIAQITGPCELVELGSGSSTKTRYLLDAYQQQGQFLRYLPVDVSGGILKDTAQHLLHDYPSLTLHGLVGTYEQALTHLPAPLAPCRMVAFIGSTLGNLFPAECDALLGRISAAMAAGDYFLLGVDLQKDPAIIERAYNDSQGVSAAFNLNMLHHLNHRFGGNFQPDQFRHVAYYNSDAHQIEAYIESQVAQTVTLAKLNLTVSFQAGERLHSEISRKFSFDSLGEMLGRFGLQPVRPFTDEAGWFGLLLAQKQGR